MHFLSFTIETKNVKLDMEIEKERKSMEIQIKDPTTDPIVLSLKYLEFCTDNFTSKVLGEGAFGKVYFGCDKELGLQIAVKRITLQITEQDQIPDQETLDEITLSFKREIAVRTQNSYITPTHYIEIVEISFLTLLLRVRRC